jgi:hypothetical protein
VLRIFIRAVRTTLCGASPDAPRVAQLGALSFFHRFGSRPRRVLSTFTLSSTTAWKWEVRVEHPALARLHDVSADGLKFLASVPQAEGPTVLVSVSWTAGLPPVE